MEITYRIDGKECKTECTDDYIRIEDRKQSGRRTVVVTCEASAGLTLVSSEILMEHTFHLFHEDAVCRQAPAGNESHITPPSHLAES